MENTRAAIAPAKRLSLWLARKDKRPLLLFALLLLGLSLSIILLSAISATAKSTKEIDTINVLLQQSQDLRIRYNLTKEAMATFMFLGSEESWKVVETELSELLVDSKTLSDNTALTAPEYNISAQLIADQIELFLKEIPPLKSIRLDARGVISGVRTSNVTQAEHNYLFIANVAEALSLLSFEETSINNSQLIIQLQEAQTLWLRMLVEFRAHLLLRGDVSLEAMQLHLEQFNLAWDSVIANKEEFGLVAQSLIEQAHEKQIAWQSTLPEVLTVHMSNRWRRDLRFVEDKLSPISNIFLTTLKSYSHQLNLQHKSLNQDLLSSERATVVWAFVLMALITLTTFSLLLIFNRLLKEQRAKRTAAENISNMKTEFLSRMSHELRTPLNAIIGFGHLLKINKAEPLSNQQFSNVNEITNAGDHLLKLINELLDLSAIESGNAKLDMQKVNLKTAVSECLSLSGPMASDLNITINDQISVKSECFVLADPTRLRQVLINLITNAIKYNCKQGSVFLYLIHKHNKVRINVKDTGPGIVKEDMEKIFQPFERLRASADIDGSGIGLLVTKDLIHSMGGKIGLTSNRGDGCTFWVELRVAEAA